MKVSGSVGWIWEFVDSLLSHYYWQPACSLTSSDMGSFSRLVIKSEIFVLRVLSSRIIGVDMGNFDSLLLHYYYQPVWSITFLYLGNSSRLPIKSEIFCVPNSFQFQASICIAHFF